MIHTSVIPLPLKLIRRETKAQLENGVSIQDRVRLSHHKEFIKPLILFMPLITRDRLERSTKVVKEQIHPFVAPLRRLKLLGEPHQGNLTTQL